MREHRASAGKATVDLKVLEQQGKAQTTGTFLVFKESKLIFLKSPFGNQFIVRPKPLHIQVLQARKKSAAGRAAGPTADPEGA